MDNSRLDPSPFCVLASWFIQIRFQVPWSSAPLSLISKGGAKWLSKTTPAQRCLYYVMTPYLWLGSPVSAQQAYFSSGPLPPLASAVALMLSLPSLQILPTGFALNSSPLAGAFDFYCTEKIKSSEHFQLPSLKTYSVTCICTQLESKDAGCLLWGASSFTSTESCS